jgi:hypothetical protein
MRKRSKALTFIELIIAITLSVAILLGFFAGIYFTLNTLTVQQRASTQHLDLAYADAFIKANVSNSVSVDILGSSTVILAPFDTDVPERKIYYDTNAKELLYCSDKDNAATCEVVAKHVEVTFFNPVNAAITDDVKLLGYALRHAAFSEHLQPLILHSQVYAKLDAHECRRSGPVVWIGKISIASGAKLYDGEGTFIGSQYLGMVVPSSVSVNPLTGEVWATGDAPYPTRDQVWKLREKGCTGTFTGKSFYESGFLAGEDVSVDPIGNRTWSANPVGERCWVAAYAKIFLLKEDASGNLVKVAEWDAASDPDPAFHGAPYNNRWIAVSVDTVTGDCWAVAMQSERVVRFRETAPGVISVAGYVDWSSWVLDVAADPAHGECWAGTFSGAGVFKIGEDATGNLEIKKTLPGLFRCCSVSADPIRNECWTCEYTMSMQVARIGEDASGALEIKAHTTARDPGSNTLLGDPAHYIHQPRRVSVDPETGFCWVLSAFGTGPYKVAQDGKVVKIVGGNDAGDICAITLTPPAE